MSESHLLSTNIILLGDEQSASLPDVGLFYR